MTVVYMFLLYLAEKQQVVAVLGSWKTNLHPSRTCPGTDSEMFSPVLNSFTRVSPEALGSGFRVRRGSQDDSWVAGELQLDDTWMTTSYQLDDSCKCYGCQVEDS